MSKISQKRCNQEELNYFDLHFDKTYKESEILLVEKNVYYNNMVLFMQRV